MFRPERRFGTRVSQFVPEKNDGCPHMSHTTVMCLLGCIFSILGVVVAVCMFVLSCDLLQCRLSVRIVALVPTHPQQGWRLSPLVRPSASSKFGPEARTEARLFDG